MVLSNDSAPHNRLRKRKPAAAIHRLILQGYEFSYLSEIATLFHDARYLDSLSEQISP